MSTEQFPAQGWLPENVNLSVLDALAPLPDHLTEMYDIVHVGLVVMLIRDENPEPLMQNLIKMLSK